MIKFHPYILILLFLVLGCARQAQRDNCDPNYFCDTQPYADGEVKIAISYDSQPIPVTVYLGYVEEDSIVLHEMVTSKEVIYYLPVGKRYAVEASYKEGNKTIITLDGGMLKEKKVYNCDSTCYELPKLRLDLTKLQ